LILRAWHTEVRARLRERRPSPGSPNCGIPRSNAWETLEFEYELIDAGDRVIMLLEQRMRGRSTGIEVPMGKYAQIATFQDG
jgi:hypothetical protein